MDREARRRFAVTTARGRFAPSPTGRLHFGSLVAALGSWLFARSAGAAWIVRMEDLDREREVDGAAADILATLDAFGLASDEPVVFQSARTALYAQALAQLERDGHAYRCWCSRSDLEPFGGIHPSSCIAPARERPAAWRLRVGSESIGFDDRVQGPRRQDLARDVGDFVIWRADGACAYQLAVVVDDAAQCIGEVVRGADLLDSTPRQILLQRRLGLPQPRHAHLPLALGADGRKLSKHEAALAVDAHDPLPALRAALQFLGQPSQAERNVHMLLSRASRAFDAARIPRKAAAPAAFAAARNATS
ncbi:tRNA glutamyl-Q(34) synthetase GluQRS [Dokdonella sp.]|uniref:tRNA glutamyl-Q(34) synthetase GluQRS n=1 Tax=Dokdonella sp. TaxID=2291710 RepID=UPI002F3F0A66